MENSKHSFCNSNGHNYQPYANCIYCTKCGNYISLWDKAKDKENPNENYEYNTNLINSENTIILMANSSKGSCLDGKTDDSSYSGAKADSYILLEIKNPLIMNYLKFKFYAADSRKYEYKIMVSTDLINWEILKTVSNKEVIGWEGISFEPKQIKYIKFTGSNTANDYVHICYIEGMLKNDNNTTYNNKIS